MWTQAEAVQLCRQIEFFAPTYGCHVALTGGALYKDGVRKDIDLVFYRIRQTPEIDVPGLVNALFRMGIHVLADHGFCIKARLEGRDIDLLFPERAQASIPSMTRNDYF